MRIIVFFDLPVTSSAQRKAATQFRNSLLKDGYQMLQFSVYSRICNGVDAVEKHRLRLLRALPKEGAIRMLTITEKQYANMEILLGTQAAADDNISIDDLMLSIF